MKKFMYLFITVLAFSSCGSDENDVMETADSIVGKWQITSILANGAELSDDCSKKNTIEYKANSNFTQTTNTESTANNVTTCSADPVISGTWENTNVINSDGTVYSLTVGNDTRQGTIRFTNNNTVYIVRTQENGMTLDRTYKKI